ncbi:metallophosphoesterase [Nocardioides sp. CFH 31398]|uniref:metallophosphoesterase family protein n=1 Tax=Nocardioides sp. CFH 31398 TaxID=2919579 RepID=UPI001F06AEF4|nr:metallophosphoesterase [Nocardioides sp. CFH 31398]MCH1867605.1 metallophosphoesterase [Nocardioides sp. CFH 31398]
MRARARRAVVVALAALVGFGLVQAAAPSTSLSGSSTDGRESDGPAPATYRFLSAPDFMNADVADLSGSPRWRPGLENSWNDSWAVAVDTVMDAFEAEAPQDVLVAGDLVNGHWGAQPSEVFGPVDTEEQRRDAVRRAAEAYFPAWRRLFDERGLPVHVAVGDHEVGDNDWAGSAKNDFKRRNLGLFKEQFAQHALRPGRYDSRPPGPANRTAYAVRLAPEVQLVSVDVFEQTPDDVVPRLDPQQLAWLDDVLAEAQADGVDWIMVQGHVPVARPVRQTSSSGLYYEGGASSPFWRTLARHDVDLYLSGEVHDVTAARRSGVMQISHGGIFGHGGHQGRGGTSYVVGQVEGDTLELVAKRFRVSETSGEERLWQATSQGEPPLEKTFVPTPEVIGTMRLTSDGEVLSQDGQLGPYTPND